MQHWQVVGYLWFLLISPPAKWLSSDVTMHAVHFWGRERGLPVGREYLWLKKKVGERGKGASALEWNISIKMKQNLQNQGKRIKNKYCSEQHPFAGWKIQPIFCKNLLQISCFFRFLYKKRWKWLFRPAFGVPKRWSKYTTHLCPKMFFAQRVRVKLKPHTKNCSFPSPLRKWTKWERNITIETRYSSKQNNFQSPSLVAHLISYLDSVSWLYLHSATC